MLDVENISIVIFWGFFSYVFLKNKVKILRRKRLKMIIGNNFVTRSFANGVVFVFFSVFNIIISIVIYAIKIKQ